MSSALRQVERPVGRVVTWPYGHVLRPILATLQVGGRKPRARPCPAPDLRPRISARGACSLIASGVEDRSGMSPVPPVIAAGAGQQAFASPDGGCRTGEPDHRWWPAQRR